MTAELSPADRVDAMRRELPFRMQQLTQFVVDNPGQIAIIGASTLVACMAARNICKPRNLVEVLALMAVLDVGACLAVGQIVKNDWLNLKVRDEDGKLVSLKTIQAGER
jgi:hypothetical protein